MPRNSRHVVACRKSTRQHETQPIDCLSCVLPAERFRTPTGKTQRLQLGQGAAEPSSRSYYAHHGASGPSLGDVRNADEPPIPCTSWLPAAGSYRIGLTTIYRGPHDSPAMVHAAHEETTGNARNDRRFSLAVEYLSAGRILGDFPQKIAHRTARLPAQLLSGTFSWAFWLRRRWPSCRAKPFERAGTILIRAYGDQFEKTWSTHPAWKLLCVSDEITAGGSGGCVHD